jgi:hypothetical protein
VSISNTKSVEFCQNFFTGCKICDACSTDIAKFLTHEPYYFFVVAVAISIVLCDVCEKMWRDLIAIDKSINFSFAFRAIYSQASIDS